MTRRSLESEKQSGYRAASRDTEKTFRAGLYQMPVYVRYINWQLLVTFQPLRNAPFDSAAEAVRRACPSLCPPSRACCTWLSLSARYHLLEAISQRIRVPDLVSGLKSCPQRVPPAVPTADRHMPLLQPAATPKGNLDNRVLGRFAPKHLASPSEVELKAKKCPPKLSVLAKIRLSQIWGNCWIYTVIIVQI